MTDSDFSGGIGDMSLSDLMESPVQRKAPQRSSRFTLLAQRDVEPDEEDGVEADESYIEEEEAEVGDDEHTTELEHDGQDVEEQPKDPTTPPYTAPPLAAETDDADQEEPPEEADLIEATPKGPGRSDVSGASRHVPIVSPEDKLRQQLFDLQRINEAFDLYHGALLATKEKQKMLVTKVDRTKQLLDRYVAILGQTEHNSRLLLDPTWDGASADEARIAEERAREEEARIEREEALRREEEERIRKEEQAREAAERAASASAARGRGIASTRGGLVRGRGVPVVRGRTPIPPPGSRVPSKTTASSTNSSSLSPSGIARGRAKPSGLRAPTAGRGIPRGVGARGAGRGV